jgi:hypothetical protein
VGKGEKSPAFVLYATIVLSGMDGGKQNWMESRGRACVALWSAGAIMVNTEPYSQYSQYSLFSQPPLLEKRIAPNSALRSRPKPTTPYHTVSQPERQSLQKPFLSRKWTSLIIWFMFQPHPQFVARRSEAMSSSFGIGAVRCRHGKGAGLAAS